VAIAWIHWHRPYGDARSEVTVSCGGELREFASYSDALVWAEAHAERLWVFVDGVRVDCLTGRQVKGTDRQLLISPPDRRRGTRRPRGNSSYSS
jgi:hypothetical protein